MDTKLTTSKATPTRRPYHGSCHCGFTRYICYMTLPPDDVSPSATPSQYTRIRKCNCTICLKASYTSVRLADAPNDFVLLSPTDPFKDLGEYTWNTHTAHWFFCPTCGVRCFVFEVDEANGEMVDIDLEAWLGKESEGKVTEVWRPKKEGWNESAGEGEKGTYLGVFATSLEAGQEGLDLREWHEKGWIVYFDQRGMKEEPGKGPFDGGVY